MSEAKPRICFDELDAVFKRLVQIEKRLAIMDARDPVRTPTAITGFSFMGYDYEKWSDAHRIMCGLTGMEDPFAAMENIQARMNLRAQADARKNWIRLPQWTDTKCYAPTEEYIQGWRDAIERTQHVLSENGIVFR